MVCGWFLKREKSTPYSEKLHPEAAETNADNQALLHRISGSGDFHWHFSYNSDQPIKATDRKLIPRIYVGKARTDRERQAQFWLVGPS
jgi:hypothetical protein